MFLIRLHSSDDDTHPLPRAMATLIYRYMNNLRAVHLLETKLESTVRYLGIAVDDALQIAEHTEDRPTIGRGSCGPVVEPIRVGSPCARRAQRSSGR